MFGQRVALKQCFLEGLLSLAIAIAFFSNLGVFKKLLFTGVVLYLNILVRPDGVLFVVAANAIYLVWALVNKCSFKDLLVRGLVLNAGMFFILIPYLVWKINYYGDIFPNTYYAKNGGGSNFEKGLIYLQSYFQFYWTSLLWIPSVLIALAVKVKNEGLKNLLKDKNIAILLALAFVVLVYVFGFIARVGGGFMYARFLVPIIPLFYFMIEVAAVILVKHLNLKKVYYYGAVSALCLLLSLSTKAAKTARDSLFFTENEKTKKLEIHDWNGIIDEHYYYTEHYKLDAFTKIGKQLALVFKDIDVKVLQRGDCCMSYYARFPYVLENFGLTDKAIAHMPLPENAKKRKIGHQRNASLDYIKEREINFCFMRSMYVEANYRLIAFNLTGASKYRAEMFFYDKELIKKLVDRMGKHFMYTDFERYVDAYIYTTHERFGKRENKRSVSRI